MKESRDRQAVLADLNSTNFDSLINGFSETCKDVTVRTASHIRQSAVSIKFIISAMHPSELHLKNIGAKISSAIKSRECDFYICSDSLWCDKSPI